MSASDSATWPMCSCADSTECTQSSSGVSSMVWFSVRPSQIRIAPQKTPLRRRASISGASSPSIFSRFSGRRLKASRSRLSNTRAPANRIMA